MNPNPNSNNQKPNIRPENPLFSCGPCRKPPNWDINKLAGATLGRSHRSSEAKAKLYEVIKRSAKLVELPADWKVAIVPASNTGAFEMAIWNLISEEVGVDIFSWDAFSKDWAYDITQELKVKNVKIFDTDYGKISDLSKADASKRDVVITWNATSSGVKIPTGDWIASDRKGLVICDATSAILTMPLPYDKLDVITWSWQKTLGGEAAHGMIALSPYAWQEWQRRQQSQNARAIPKIFRLSEPVFLGNTINTPSLLAVEDVLACISWAESIGGLKGMLAKCNENFQVIEKWVESSDWIEFFVKDKTIRSQSSVTLSIKNKPISTAKKIRDLLEKEEIAFDINPYPTAPEGFRIWCGATVGKDDLKALLHWMDWAFNQLT